MKRVYLLIEEFTELTFLETLLKKIGFDTLGSQVVLGSIEKAMSVTPEILVMSDIIKSQSTHEALQSFKKYRPSLKVVLLKKDLKYATPHNLQLVDLIAKSPIDPEDFLRKLSKSANLNEELIIEKFHKLGLFKGEKGSAKIVVQGGASSTSDEPVNKFVQSLKVSKEDKKNEERKKRFESELNRLTEVQKKDVKEKTYDHKVALKEMQEYRDREGDPEIQEIDEQRKRFTNALFKK